MPTVVRLSRRNALLRRRRTLDGMMSFSAIGPSRVLLLAVRSREHTRSAAHRTDALPRATRARRGRHPHTRPPARRRPADAAHPPHVLRARGRFAGWRRRRSAFSRRGAVCGGGVEEETRIKPFQFATAAPYIVVNAPRRLIATRCIHYRHDLHNIVRIGAPPPIPGQYTIIV